MEDILDLQALIVRDFDITSSSETLSEEVLISFLADQIAYYMEHKLESLMSLMYRLDIEEAKVNEILSVVHEEPTNILLAKLIIQRQKQRIFTKKYYQQARLGDIDEKLQW
jgi:hypothetical protein